MPKLASTLPSSRLPHLLVVHHVLGCRTEFLVSLDNLHATHHTIRDLSPDKRCRTRAVAGGTPHHRLPEDYPDAPAQCCDTLTIVKYKITLLTASRKSFSVTVFRRARMAYMPASVQTLLMSAPVEFGHSLHAFRTWFSQLVCPEPWKRSPDTLSPPAASPDKQSIPRLAQLEDCGISACEQGPSYQGACLDRSSKRMSRSQFMVRVWIWKICVRDSRSGSPNSTFLSKRPGLNSAGSRVSGLLVAISTCTSPLLSLCNYECQRIAPLCKESLLN